MPRTKRMRFQPRGIVLDQPPQFVPDERFTGGSNVGFRHDRITRAGGYTSVWQSTNPFPWPPMQGAYSPDNTSIYWVMCAAQHVFVTDGTTHTDITPTAPLTTVLPNAWTITNLNGLSVFSNGIDVPFWWNENPQFNCEPLPDFVGNAASVRAYKNHLVAMSVGQDIQKLLWSDAAAAGQIPDSWTAGADSEAGDNVLGDEVGAIIDGAQLRDDFVIYKRNATYLMTYVGQPVIMAFRKLFTGVGLLNKNCVAEYKSYHYCITDGDIIRHDGQNFESLIDDRNRETIFALISPDYYDRAHVEVNPQEDEVLFFFPSEFGAESQYPNIIVVYHVDGGFVSYRDAPNVTGAGVGIVVTGAPEPGALTWDTIQGSWQEQTIRWNQGSQTTGSVTDAMIWFSSQGDMAYWADDAPTANGDIIQARINRGSTAMGSPGVVKLVTKIWPEIKAVQGTVLNFRVSGQIELADSGTGTIKPFTVGVDKWLDVLVSGKYISFEISSESASLWEVVGWDVEYREMSYF